MIGCQPVRNSLKARARSKNFHFSQIKGLVLCLQIRSLLCQRGCQLNETYEVKLPKPTTVCLGLFSQFTLAFLPRSFSFLISYFSFSFLDLKCHFLKSQVSAGFAHTLSLRHQVFFPASKQLWPLCVPGPSSLTLETWGETLSPQKLRPDGSKDNQTFSLPLWSDAQRSEDVSFLPGCSLTSQSLFLTFDHASVLGGSPSARLGEKPFQKSTKGGQVWGCLPA